MAFKMKRFKPHNMYKKEKANTYKEHLALEKKGYDHSPYDKKPRAAFYKKGPCWKGYEMIGMKKKGGRMVPNCVPKK
tara:strand:+ start:290 stop:520 length:231 start_codon:yes stop_codon:yes gene_type:complete